MICDCGYFCVIARLWSVTVAIFGVIARLWSVTVARLWSVTVARLWSVTVAIFVHLLYYSLKVKNTLQGMKIADSDLLSMFKNNNVISTLLMCITLTYLYDVFHHVPHNVWWKYGYTRLYIIVDYYFLTKNTSKVYKYWLAFSSHFISFVLNFICLQSDQLRYSK